MGMIQVEEPHLQRLPSEIHTDTSKELSTSSPWKECTAASLSMPVLRHPSPLEIFFQSALRPRVLSCPTVKERRETEAPSPEPPELLRLSLVTLMMAGRLELDFHPEPEKPYHPPA